MEGFLTHVCDHLLQTLHTDLQDCVLVFPDKRAQWFFLEALSQRLTRTLRQPVCCSLADLAATAAGKHPADELILVVHLYQVFLEQNPGAAQDFDSFYTLGLQILQDFDLIDKYRVDPELLLANLRDLKGISQDFSFLSEEQRRSIHQFWSAFDPGEDKPNSLTRKFLGIWDKLLPLYKGFRQVLADKAYSYSGALWRELVERPQAASAFPAPHYAFIGFSALNACEQGLFSLLQAAGKALFYWDYDPYYTEDPHQEAGRFLRQNLRDFPAPADFTLPPSFAQAKEIRVLPVPAAVTQAKLVNAVMDRGQYHTDRRTAVVLAQENLLLPLLYSLGERSHRINVTMGYPLRQTPVLTFLELLLGKPAHPSPEIGPADSLLSQDLLPLLHHPCTRWLLPRDTAWDPVAYATGLEKQNRLFLTRQEVEALPIGPLFRLPSGSLELVAFLSGLLLQMRESGGAPTQDNPLVENALATVYQQLNLLYTAFEALPVALSPQLASRLVLRHLRRLSVPFSGLPVEGLQVMGLLETRCLDFEHLIILSAQEDCLPRSTPDTSLIPYSLKKAFGLAGREEQEALWAYHFYRLIQRAQKISLLYATSSSGTKVGEKSRYIRQLEWESGHKVIYDQVSYALHTPEGKPMIKVKTPEVMARLAKFWKPQEEAYLSPSALMEYLLCPLRFYFHHVEGLRERQELSADFDHAHFGDVVHHSLERLYQDYLQQPIPEETLQELRDPTRLEPLVQEEINRLYFNDPAASPTLWHGSWHIMKAVAVRYIQQVLDTDLRHAPVHIYDLESPFSCVLPVTIDGEQMNVRLGGRVDRLDLAPDSSPQAPSLVLIDYKTGKEKYDFPSLSALLSPQSPEAPGADNSKFHEHKYIMQVMTYAFLFHLGRQQQGRALASIPLPKLYFIRSMTRPSGGEQHRLYHKGLDQEVRELESYAPEFWDLLKKLLHRMLDPAYPFCPTSYKKERCPFCPYREICQNPLPEDPDA